MIRFVRWLWGQDLGKIVRIKSWVPGIDPYGIGWPTILTDRNYCRETITPIWNRDWFRERFFKRSVNHGNQAQDQTSSSTAQDQGAR